MTGIYISEIRSDIVLSKISINDTPDKLIDTIRHNMFDDDIYKNIDGNNMIMIKKTNDIINKIKRINENVYIMKYNAHAGHVFAYILHMIEKYNKEEYVLGVTSSYYNKYKHVIDFYNIIRKDKLVIFDPECIYEFKQIYHKDPFNKLVPLGWLFTTEDIIGTKNYIDNKDNISSEYDIHKIITIKENVYRSCHWKYINECIEYCLEKHKNDACYYENILLIKNDKSTIYNNTPNRGFNLDNLNPLDELTKWKLIDPLYIDFSYLVFLLYKCKNIVTSWSTIMYINKFFFNPCSKIIVLCHKLYNEEYSYEKHRRTIYYIDNDVFYYIFNLDTYSIDNKIIKHIEKILL